MALLITFVSPDSGALFTLEFDAVVAERHSLAAVVSQHPVARGVDIADHVRPQLAEVTITGAVSDTPLNRSVAALTRGSQESIDIYALQSRRTADATAFAGYTSPQIPALTFGFAARRRDVVSSGTPATYEERAGAVGSFSYLAFAEPVGRTRAFFQIFDVLRTRGVPVKITTDLREYPQMLLTSVSVTRDGTTSIALELSFREFSVAETQTVRIRGKKVPPKKAATAPVEQRAKAPKRAALPPTVIKPQTSVMKALGEYVVRGVQ